MRSRVDDHDGWIENRPSSGRRALFLDELWSYRELVAFFALRDVKVRYKQAVLGGAWAILQPLAGAAIFTVVFGHLANLPSDGIPYLVFAFAGFSLWTYFSSAVNTARNSLVGNSALITKVYFPRLAAPIASVIPGLIDLAVALVLLAGLLIWEGMVPSVAILGAPVFLVLAVLIAFGTGTLLAAVTVQYRDVEQVFAFLVQLWFFATPVVYPSSLIRGPWRWAYRLNPMVGVMDGWRWALLDGPAPGWELLVSLVVTVLLLVVSLQVFQRNERRFADVI